MRIWRIPRWRWLVVPVLGGTGFLIAVFLLLGHVDEESATWVGHVSSYHWFIYTVFGAIPLTVFAYIMMIWKVATYNAHGDAPPPSFLFSDVEFTQGVDTCRWDAILHVRTPYAVPYLRVTATSPTICGVQIYGRVTTALTHPNEGSNDDGSTWSELPIAVGDYKVMVTTRERESAIIVVSTSGVRELVIREVFTPK